MTRSEKRALKSTLKRAERVDGLKASASASTSAERLCSIETRATSSFLQRLVTVL